MKRVPIMGASILIGMAMIACGGFVSATATPVPTSTPVPTKTATLRPTATQLPTQTSTPRPVGIGTPVQYAGLEITVLDVINRESVHFGDISSDGRWETFYKPNPGSYIIDVGVQVRNLDSGSPQSMQWQYVYIEEESGNMWYPAWGRTKDAAAGKTLDPFSIGLSSDQIDGLAEVTFGENTYMRLIYGVADTPGQVILFRIGDSPAVAFEVPKR